MDKKKMKIVAAIAAVAVLLIAGIVGVALGEKPAGNMQVDGMQTADKLANGENGQGSITNTGEDAPQVELVGGKKPSFSMGKWDPINPINFEYDLKVTTHNVGNFYYGVTNLDVYGAQVNVHEGILPEYVLGADNDWKNAMKEMDSDIYALQEWQEIYMIDSKKNLTITSKDAFADVFKTLKTSTWDSWSGRTSGTSALAVTKDSEYEITDVTSGYLSAKDPEVRRGYVKGYVKVNGIKVAVYSIHLEPRETEEKQAARADQYRELAELMKEDVYAIAMGDMNCNDIAEYMIEQGFNVANMGEFGEFNTYYYSESGKNLDNIITTPNIEMLYAECTPGLKGGSDHYPVTAYLKVTKDASDLKDSVAVGDDGFIDAWYKP